MANLRIEPNHTPLFSPIKPPQNIPVAIYARVSTASQVGGRFDSCETQVSICRDYLRGMSAHGWFEVAEITDAAYSGGDSNRPGMFALKQLIEAGAVKAVLVYRLDRILRCTDGWSAFRNLLKKHDCRLISPSEGLSEHSPADRLRNNILVSVAEYERLNTADKVRSKMLEQAKRGIWNSGLVPYGYDYDGKAKVLLPNTAEAQVVERIFRDAAKMVPIPEMAQRLLESGTNTRERTHLQRNGEILRVGGKPFRPDTLKALIANPIYAGRLRFKGQEFQGNHAPLVSASLWERANAAIAQPAKRTRQCDPLRNKYANFLKGLVQCGCCGQMKVPLRSGRRPNGQRYDYYVCMHSMGPESGERCLESNVPASFLETALIEVIDQCSRHPDILKTAVRLAQQESGTEIAQWRQELENADGALSATTQKLKHYTAAIESGKLDFIKQELSEGIRALTEEKQRQLVQREQLLQQLRIADLEFANAENFRGDLQEFVRVFSTSMSEQKPELAQRLFVKVEIRPFRRRGEKGVTGLFRVSLKLRSSVSGLHATSPSESVLDGEGDLKPQQPVKVDVVIPAPRSDSSALTFFPGDSAIVVSLKDAPQVPVPSERLHPLHRALKWGLRLRTEPSLNRITLASEENVCPATITHHLKLLQLAPEIQVKLLGITSQADLTRYSLNKMKALADLPPHEQLVRFGDN